MQSLRKLLEKNQKAVLALVGLAVLFIIYNTFIKKEDLGVELVSESEGIRNLELGREIIVTLNRLKTIQIDTGILEDPRFEKLQDFSQPLPQYAASKQNPFEIEIPGTTVQPAGVEVTNPVIAPAAQEPVTEESDQEEAFDASGIN